MTMQARAAAIGLCLALLAVKGDAHAANAQQVRRDCTADALRLCLAAIPRGRASIIRCMLANRDKLSPRCKAHLH